MSIYSQRNYISVILYIGTYPAFIKIYRLIAGRTRPAPGDKARCRDR